MNQEKSAKYVRQCLFVLVFPEHIQKWTDSWNSKHLVKCEKIKTLTFFNLTTIETKCQRVIYIGSGLGEVALPSKVPGLRYRLRTLPYCCTVDDEPSPSVV